MLGEVHWGSPENLSDVTHPFLYFSLYSPGSLSEYFTTHCFLTLIVVLMKFICKNDRICVNMISLFTSVKLSFE